jgi:hypothetical protein
MTFDKKILKDGTLRLYPRSPRKTHANNALYCRRYRAKKYK